MSSHILQLLIVIYLFFGSITSTIDFYAYFSSQLPADRIITEANKGNLGTPARIHLLMCTGMYSHTAGPSKSESGMWNTM